VEVGQEGVVFLELMPGPGESVRGAWVSLSVNPEYIMLLADRQNYASDPAFSKVEKFSVDALSGALVFRVQTDEPLAENKILLRIPLKFIQVGLSSITFTSSIYGEDMARTPSNSGYQRLAGYQGNLDPMLLSSLEGGNSTLTATTLAHDIEFTAPERQAAIMEASLGVTALEEASGDEDADVVIEFSKREATIGLRQWVRLDVVITKFPESELLAAAAFKVKYNPQVFTYTDSRGQEAESVELNDFFNLGFVNKVNRNQGEIDIQLGVDLMLEDTSMLQKMPVTLVSLYFKGMQQVTSEPITLEEVKVPVTRPGSKLSRHAASVTIKPSEKGCDSDLPATLCTGSFKVSGTMSFNISNKDEVRSAVERFSSDEVGTSENVSVKKFFLEQRWNLGMNGSLRNGIRLKGSLIDEPNVEQRLNMEMIGQDTIARFGDFNATIKDSTLVALKPSDVTGFQLEHKYNGLTVRGVLAELKSSTANPVTITGQGKKGPYNLGASSGAIIPASVTVYRQNELLDAEEYTIDYARNQIHFSEDLQSNETAIVNYQQSSLLFSTGNIRALRMDYETSNKNVRVGSTYITTMSPKNTSQVRILTTEAVNESQIITQESSTGTTKSFDCGFFGVGHSCFEIKLAHNYIVEGSIEIKNDLSSDTNTYTVDSKYVYIDHRGHLDGRFYVDTSRFPAVKMNVTYTYYNPSNVTQRAFVLFPIRAIDQGSRNILIDTEGAWPTDMFPGSEVLYLSNDQEYDVSEGSDQIVCFKDARDLNKVDKDKTTFCPGTYSESAYTYYFENTGYDTTIRIPDEVVRQSVLKVLYTPVPPDLAGGSEFQKVAWGVDTNFKIGKRFEVKAEYAQANSDLSASFNTTEDQIVVDPNTLESNTSTIVKSHCTYDPTGDAAKTTDDKLICRLSHTDLFGTVLLKVQLCNEFDNTKEVCSIYDTITYDILVPRNRVDQDKGTITFERGEWMTEYGNLIRFPNQGDKLYVTFSYEQKLDQLVTGDAYYVDSSYTGKNIQFNLHKSGQDPFFDDSVSLVENNSVDELSGDVTMAIGKKWKLKYDWKDANEQRIDNETGALSSDIVRDNSAMSLSFNSKVIKSLKFTTSRNRSSGFTGGADEANRIYSDEENTNDALDFLISMKGGVYSVLGNLGKKEYNYMLGSKPNTSSVGSTYAFKYVPSQKFDLGFTKGNLHTNEGNTSDTLAYNLNIRVIPLVKELRLEFKDTDTRPRYGADSSEVQDVAYNLQFQPLWKINNLNMDFRRQDTPGGTTDYPDAKRSESLTMGFNTQYKNYLKFTPSYTKNMDSIETKSYNNSTGLKWTLEYKLAKSKFNPHVTYTRNKNNTRNRNLTTDSAESPTSTKTSTLVLDFDPTNKISVSVTNDRSTGSSAPTRSKDLSLAYHCKLFQAISLDSRLAFNRTFGVNSKRSNTRSLNLSWPMTIDTSLSLKYHRSATTSGSSSATLPVTTFTLETQTKFD
jgi:hypothetical protein